MKPGVTAKSAAAVLSIKLATTAMIVITKIAIVIHCMSSIPTSVTVCYDGLEGRARSNAIFSQEAASAAGPQPALHANAD